MTDDTPPRYVTMSKSALMAHFGLSTRGIQLMARRKKWRHATWMASQKIYQVPVTDLDDEGDGRRKRKDAPPLDPSTPADSASESGRMLPGADRMEQDRPETRPDEAP